MKRILPLFLLASASAPLGTSCSAPPPARVEAWGAVLESAELRVHFRPDRAEVYRAGAEFPTAYLTGPRFERPEVRGTAPPEIAFPGGTYTLRGRQLAFSAEVTVEVPRKRSMALFPGLEFLEAGELSSSDRDARGALADRRRPEPWKVTVPLMAYEVEGVLVALFWKDPVRPFFEARERSLMGLPGVPAVLHVEPGATIYDAVPRWTETYGLPAPERWPRSLQEEIDLCKEGFRTVGDGSGKFRHCVGWGLDWTPGFATLLHVAGEKVDWSNYLDLLSTANCHIMKWEAAFYAQQPLRVRGLVDRMLMHAEMRVDGEWIFDPKEEKQRTLGKPGDKVLGTSAHNVLALAKAARMTGEAELRAPALETLRILRKYKVPRGAQAWECPLYEPDLLAAAYAVGAYVEAFKLSRDPAFLEDAVRWAKAGLPFLFLWSLPGRPGMLYGSVPVFGTTHYTHSWFGVPVQWNGLVYAYYLRKLAPLDRSFDWLKVADGITASAVHQQYPDGPSKGCYPDALYDQCSRRAAPDINPENILVNVLTAIGRDPDPDLRLRP